MTNKAELDCTELSRIEESSFEQIPCTKPEETRCNSSDKNNSSSETEGPSNKYLPTRVPSPAPRPQTTISLNTKPLPSPEEDSSDSDDNVMMNTIKRAAPVRPPRNIDGGIIPPSSDYYNLIQSNIDQTKPEHAPTIPRRKPYISNPDLKIESQNVPADWYQPRSRCGSQVSGGTLTSLKTTRKRNTARPKRRGSCQCRNVTAGDSGTEAVKDRVVLLYSRYCTGSVEWARYLDKLFTELSRHKGGLTVEHLPVEDLTEVQGRHLVVGSCKSVPHSVENDVQHAKLQLMIMSPVLLSWLASHPGQVVGRLLQQDKVIAILLGVREEQVTSEHRSSLVSFPQWVHLEARDHDLEFVQTVLYFSTQILARGSSRGSGGTSSESLAFTLFPRKVTESQPRLVVILDKPLNSRSAVRLLVERTNGYRTVMEDVKIKNSFTIAATMPSCYFARSSLVNVYLEIDRENKGFRQLKVESRPHELDTILSSLLDPLEFLCHSMAIAPSCRDQLDERLTANLLANIPSHGFNLLSFSDRDRNIQSSTAEYPTLLHFSASHGLPQLCETLLSCPGSQSALQQSNCHGLTPLQLARQAGHHHIVDILSSSHIYDYVKTDDNKYEDRVKTCSDNYKIPPYEDRVRNFSENYKIPPPPRPIAGSTPCKAGNYMDMSGSGTPSPCPSRKGGYVRQNVGGRNGDLDNRTHQRPDIGGHSVMDKFNLETGRHRLAREHKDPFGTMRGTGTRRSLKETNRRPGVERLYVNDPFGTLRASRASSVPKSVSSDEVFTEEQTTERLEDNPPDYRGVGDDMTDSLAITEDLFDMLEQFKKKNYTVKEMELMFNSWRRKASIPPREGKTDGRQNNRTTNCLKKLFQVESNTDHSVRKTEGTKQFSRQTSEKIDENQLQVVELPSTPLKPDETVSSSVLSTQILPLHRLSGSSLHNHSKTDNTAKTDTSATRTRPVAEVSPFSNTTNITTTNINTINTNINSTTTTSDTRPNDHTGVQLRRQKSNEEQEKTEMMVRRKLHKMRRSITEPLMQYFHEIHMTSPELDEPDILNTPKSVLVTQTKKEMSSRLSRSLFGERHKARHSQIHEYQNLSPTPSTDL